MSLTRNDEKLCQTLATELSQHLEKVNFKNYSTFFQRAIHKLKETLEQEIKRISNVQKRVELVDIFAKMLRVTEKNYDDAIIKQLCFVCSEAITRVAVEVWQEGEISFIKTYKVSPRLKNILAKVVVLWLQPRIKSLFEKVKDLNAETKGHKSKCENQLKKVTEQLAQALSDKEKLTPAKAALAKCYETRKALLVERYFDNKNGHWFEVQAHDRPDIKSSETASDKAIASAITNVQAELRLNSASIRFLDEKIATLSSDKSLCDNEIKNLETVNADLTSLSIGYSDVSTPEEKLKVAQLRFFSRPQNMVSNYYPLPVSISTLTYLNLYMLMEEQGFLLPVLIDLTIAYFAGEVSNMGAFGNMKKLINSILQEANELSVVVPKHNSCLKDFKL